VFSIKDQIKPVLMENDFCTTRTKFNYFILIGFHNSKESKAWGDRVERKKYCMYAQNSGGLQKRKCFITHQAVFELASFPKEGFHFKGEMDHWNLSVGSYTL
jgi:hypothetical protein